jgi:hypothetical protein
VRIDRPLALHRLRAGRHARDVNAIDLAALAAREVVERKAVVDGVDQDEMFVEERQRSA